VRGAIRKFIENTTRYRVCDEAGDGQSAIQKAKEVCCDLVLLDIVMPIMSGVETASALRTALPETKIVGFSALGRRAWTGVGRLEEVRRGVVEA
jgi:DNA-binding NarL/FixJ family response regulator